MFITYILYSEQIGQFYTGQTQDIQKRLVEHNLGKTSFMARGKPWKLVYYIESASRREAMELEKQIKKRGAARYLSEQNIHLG